MGATLLWLLLLARGPLRKVALHRAALHQWTARVVAPTDAGMDTASLHLQQGNSIILSHVLDSSLTISSFAHSLIQPGGLVAFPTETVYGLGANALNETAVLSIFAAKKRPLTDPLIVHVHSINQIDDVFDITSANKQVQTIVYTLANAFWPGPFTMIYKASKHIPLSVTAGTGYVGVRCPNHSIALTLLKKANLPIAAPSANKFGHVSPTTSDHVLDDLGAENIIVLKDDVEVSGGCDIGIESTVCKVSNDGSSIEVLRYGAITSLNIEELLRVHGVTCAVINNAIAKNLSTGSSQVAPGQLIKHYAPDKPTYIYSSSNQGSHQGRIQLERAFVIDYKQNLRQLQTKAQKYVDLSASGDIKAAFRLVFRVLRESEVTNNIGVVIVPDLTPYLSGAQSNDQLLTKALWERLNRAASNQFITENNFD